jgi:Transcriptional regulator, AbiEi antitoxin
MPTTAEIVARVSRLAAGQWGLLTAAQAEREAVTRSQLTRLADAGVLERVERGVYATTSSTDQNRALRAAWLALDPARTAEERLADTVGSGVVSHTSAAGLHRLGDLLDDVPEVTYSQRKQTRRGIRVHRGDLTEADVTLIDGLPATTVERTVADLLRDGHDPEHIAQIIGQGVRRRVIDLPDLAERLEPLARRYGQPDGQSLVAHLLDLVGLSPAALARDLANTSAGQELMAAGRASALTEMFASMPELNKSISADILRSLDVGQIAGLLSMATRAQSPTAETEEKP